MLNLTTCNFSTKTLSNLELLNNDNMVKVGQTNIYIKQNRIFPVKGSVVHNYFTNNKG